MNKKIFAAVAAAGLLLAGSSSSSTANDSAAAGSSAAGETTNTAHVETSDGGEVSATVTKDADGKVTAIEVDETTSDGESKKEAGADYGLKKASPIGKEWDEQVKFLEDYLIENGIDSVKLNSDGYAESEDVKSGCTINLSNIMKAIEEADQK